MTDFENFQTHLDTNEIIKILDTHDYLVKIRELDLNFGAL